MEHPSSVFPIQSFPSYLDSMASTQFPENPASAASYQMQHPSSILPSQPFPSYLPMQFPENFSAIFPGLKFRPTDDELIGHYLHHKIFGGLPLSSYIIKDCDLYGSQEPWEIWEFYKRNSDDDEDLYFFAVLKKKSSNGNRICRRIGSGSWMGEDAPKEIQTNGKVIRSKKRYRYENKGSKYNGRWIIHEYSLLGHDEYVLCRIRRNDQPTKKRGLEKKRKLKEVEHFEENLGFTECFKAQNYQEQVIPEATTPVNINDVIEDNVANLSLVEVLFSSVTDDLDWVDLGDLFVEEEQRQSSFHVVDDGHGSKNETAIGSSFELNDDEFYMELFPEDKEQIQSSFQMIVDNGNVSKTETNTNSSVDENSTNNNGDDLATFFNELDDELYKELFP